MLEYTPKLLFVYLHKARAVRCKLPNTILCTELAIIVIIRVLRR